ncbi:hypothetical protein Nstercoris_01997 [Nitrosomonas stercoris]|uniref:Uncharacterized protein n=1 Tax=Nitrosomonas stercoris TaxID=1444684 RepID=A0A4Y1YNI0_9PROT|nr:hypothetical protein Nstercoris_01997 [Nitrosomonas stercoris]
MGSYYKRQCYPTVIEYHQAVASDCPTVSPDGTAFFSCEADASKITLKKTSQGLLGPVTTTTNYTPGQIACDPDQQLLDGIELAWLVVGVWVAAWAIKQVAVLLRS